MTDETPKDARAMTPEEYAAARAELLSDARKADADAEKARIMRELSAKHTKKDAAK